MHRRLVSSVVCFGLLGSGLALAGDKEAMIASAESAGPAVVTAKATIKAPDGTVLRQGSNSYTCYPQQDMMGPMCNEKIWDALISAMMKKEDFNYLWISPKVPIDVISIDKTRMKPELVQRVTDAFVGMKDSAEGREVLKAMNFAAFEPAEDSRFDPLRKILAVKDKLKKKQ